MSFLSNKFKLEVKAFEPHVASFISHTNVANIKLVPNNSNANYTIFGADASTSNMNAYMAITSNNTVDQVISLNDSNINFYKDILVRGNLVIDGYLMTIGIDVVLNQEDLFAFSKRQFIDVSSNIITNKYLEIINREIKSSSNILMQDIYRLAPPLFNDAYGIVTSNATTIEFLMNDSNYNIDKYNNKFNSIHADQLGNGTTNNYFVNDKYDHDVLIIKGDLWASNIYSAGNVNTEDIHAVKYYGDGSMLKNIYVGNGTVDSVIEGSNLFFKSEHVEMIMSASNMNVSNLIQNTYLFLQQTLTFSHEVQSISSTSNEIANTYEFSNVSNYILEKDEDFKYYQKFTFVNNSNYILSLNNTSSNYTELIQVIYQVADEIFETFTNNMIEDIDDTSIFLNNTCNLLYTLTNDMNDQIMHTMTENSNVLMSLIMGNHSNLVTKLTEYSNLFESNIQKTHTILNDYIDSSSNDYMLLMQANSENLSNYIHYNLNQSSNYLLFTSNNQSISMQDMLNSIYSHEQLQNALSSNCLHSSNIDSYIQSANSFNMIKMSLHNTSNLASITSNYFVEVMNADNKMQFIIDNSNYLQSYLQASIDGLMVHISNKYNITLNDVYDILSDLTTNNIVEGLVKLYYNDGNFNTLFNTLTVNNIADGIVHQYIVNNKYIGNLNIKGTLYASNIQVYGSISTIDTSIYQSESSILSSSNSINLQVTNTLNDIVRLYNSKNNTVFVAQNNRVGVNKTNPLHDVDIHGAIVCDNFIGQGAYMTNINLDDKSTDHLSQGSNSYFDMNRLSYLINHSNLHTSNYILVMSSNILANTRLLLLQSNYISMQANTLLNAQVNELTDLSIYLAQTSNTIYDNMTVDALNFSNYALSTSNDMLKTVNDTNTNVRNYCLNISNILLDYLNTNDYLQSNYVLSVNTSFYNQLNMTYVSTSNYLFLTSNAISAVIDNSKIVFNQSNYTNYTCNMLYNSIKKINNDISWYMQMSSNNIAKELTNANASMTNFIHSSSNTLMNYSSNMLATLNLVTNVYTVHNVYRGDEIIHLNFSNIKVLNNMDNNNFKIFNINSLFAVYPSGLMAINTYYGQYEHKYMLNSSNNIYVINSNNDDARKVSDMMNKDGFLIHFIFKADFTYNTPIYYLGNRSISLINIKLLNGFLYVSIGHETNSISIFSTSPIIPKTWYMVDMIGYVIDGVISFKLYLNQILQTILMKKNGVTYPAASLQSTLYANGLNYASQMVTVYPVVIPSYISGRTYYMVFTSTSEYSVTFAKNVTCDIFMIAGGGGGGYNYGGGGGAGAYYYATNYVFPSGSYSFKVGAGGAGENGVNSAQNGEDTFIRRDNIDVLKCKGGGYGGSYANNNFAGGSGGCGGGGLGWDNISTGSRTYAGGSTNNVGTVGTGNAGGSGYNSFTQNILSGGGGGGIGSVGQSASLTQKEGGNGGDGLIFNIKGVQEVYGGGGGGGEWATYTTSPAGLGGGAILNSAMLRVGGNAGRTNGESGGNGIQNTGSGGGSGRNAIGGSGGSGIVILRYTEDTDVSMFLGCSNIIDTFEDNSVYKSGAIYTNTYYSSNSYTGKVPQIIQYSASNYQHFNSLIEVSNYDYQYSSNTTKTTNFYDYADSRLLIGDRSIHNIDFVLTEVYTNVLLSTGYYYFVLDLQNEVSADLLIGKHTDKNMDDYFNVANYYHVGLLNNPLANIMHTSNQVTAYPIYIPEGYYRFYLRMLRTKSNRNNNYYIAKYYRTASWNAEFYNLNYKVLSYVSYNSLNSQYQNGIADWNALINTDNLTATSNLSRYGSVNVSNYVYNISHSNIVNSFFAGNRYSSSNQLSIQDFKIFNNPHTMSTDYSINNILIHGRNSETVSTLYKLKTNRWQENSSNFIYYKEGNVAIGNTIPYSASLDIFTNTILKYDNSVINSVRTNNPIWTHTGIITSSDERIKTNIQDVNDDSALQSILKIEPKSYTYVERNKNVYGFISQQVKEVIPNAVSMQTNFIPNIFCVGSIKDGVIELEVLDKNIKVGCEIMYIDDSGNRYVNRITEITKRNLYLVKIDRMLTGKMFIYGTFVEDFHVLDKSYIYTLNVCALQELYRRYSILNDSINIFDDYDSYVVNNFDVLTSRIDELKNKVMQIDILEYDALASNVGLLKGANEELLNNINAYRRIMYENAYETLDKLKEENRMLLNSNQTILNEYNALKDSVNNYTNEMITIKSIMQMNNIV